MKCTRFVLNASLRRQVKAYWQKWYFGTGEEKPVWVLVWIKENMSKEAVRSNFSHMCSLVICIVVCIEQRYMQSVWIMRVKLNITIFGTWETLDKRNKGYNFMTQSFLQHISSTNCRLIPDSIPFPFILLLTQTSCLIQIHPTFSNWIFN